MSYIHSNIPQNRQFSSKGNKQKMAGLNQSMDAGMQSYHHQNNSMGGHYDMNKQMDNKFVNNPHTQAMMSGYEKQFAQNHPVKNANHIRSGSQIVGDNFKNQGANKHLQGQMNNLQNVNFSTYDLTPAQISQLNHLTQAQNRISGDRMMAQVPQTEEDEMKQKGKRKHNLSQQIQNQTSNQRNSMLLVDQRPEIVLTQGGTYESIKSQTGFMSKIQTTYPLNDHKQIPSKRSEHGDGNKNRQKHMKNQSMSQIKSDFKGQQMIQTEQSKTQIKRYAGEPSNRQIQMMDDILANSSNKVGHQTQMRISHGNNSKDRFNQNKGSKKNKISTTSNHIILPAGSLMQGVPQLKQQLNSKHVSVTNSQHSQKKSAQSLQPQGQKQSHQRVQSLHDSASVGNNINKGFNSASNAALQQQAQIMQIYQHQAVNNIMANNQNMKGQNYSSGNQSNSRKIIPQINKQVITHHKRTNQHQISRDRDSKQLVVESFPHGNYQTYNHQNLSNSNQIKVMLNQKQNSTDSSRVSRINDNNSKRHLISGNETHNLTTEHNSNYNTTQINPHTGSMTIPQKKMKQIQNLQKINQPNIGHNQSLQNFGKTSGYQKSGLNFFEAPPGGMSAHSMAQMIHHSDSSFDNRNATNMTPQLALSMKQTINTGNFENSQPQSTHMEQKEALMMNQNMQNQIHMRQSSVNVGQGSNHSKKMSIQHRKNKSMLNNQVKMQRDPNQMNQKIRQSHENNQGKGVGKLNQIYDNYADHMQNNMYLQQQPMMNNINTVATINQSNTSLNGQAHLKQNLTQTTHRKNKTSVINNNKILGINSSSSFYPVSNFPQSLIAAESQPNATIKKIIGGTISHSNKSLRSSSSNRKRSESNDKTSSKHKYYQNNSNQKQMNVQQYGNQKESASMMGKRLTSARQAQQGQQKLQQIQRQSEQKQNNQMNSKSSNGGQNTNLDIAQYNNNQQQKYMMRKQLKPQGNIVIQQQNPGTKSSNASKNDQNLIQAQINRRQNSIIKNEHQGQKMIYINQESKYVKSNNSTNQRLANSNERVSNNRSKQSQYQRESSKKRDNDNTTPDGESVYSVSSLRAQALGIPVGEGVDLKYEQQNTRQSKLNKGSFSQQQNISSFNAEQKSDKNIEQLKDANKSYENAEKSHKRSESFTQNSSKGHNKKNSITQSEIEVNSNKFKNNSHKDKSEINQIQQKLRNHNKAQKSSMNRNRNTVDGLNDMDFLGLDSINITKEALKIGKVPPEKIADMIKASNYTLQPTDNNLSPRTKEMVGISNLIRKSFKYHGAAPKTTPEFYRAGKMLGRGAFGKVSLGMHKLSRKLVALKSINKEYMSDQKQKSKVMHEVGILLRLRHPSVVKLYETFETKRHMLLSMELCAGGDLLNYVRKRKKLDETSAKIIFKQIIQGLGYIHKKRILHRDIKLDNILLDGNGNVKIADFGVSKLVKPGDLMHEQSGTPAYIAPEILREHGYKGFKADIWSAGVVLYAMLQGTVPFKASNMKELHKMIMKGKYHFKEECSDQSKNLVKAMLDINPKTRISIPEIIKHPWMTSLPDDHPEIFNQEEKEIVKREFIYNNPQIPNRSEQVNNQVEPWDCFTELNLDSINQTLRNESEKSVILAPFNSSLSDFNEEEYQGVEATLIIHRLFNDEAPLEEKKEMVRFAARCRDQDRQYEINNNGELDNGVYHKFVYSSRDGNPDPSSSLDRGGSSQCDLRPQSSRNRELSRDDVFRDEIAKRIREGRLLESETDDYGLEDSREGLPVLNEEDRDENRIQTLKNFGYPDEYIRYCLAENESCYCLATYYLLGEDQRY